MTARRGERKHLRTDRRKTGATTLGRTIPRIRNRGRSIDQEITRSRVHEIVGESNRASNHRQVTPDVAVQVGEMRTKFVFVQRRLHREQRRAVGVGPDVNRRAGVRRDVVIITVVGNPVRRQRLHQIGSLRGEIVILLLPDKLERVGLREIKFPCGTRHSICGATRKNGFVSSAK